MISIIIPTYNEESVIATTLEHLKLQAAEHEIIVVDGFSKDNTVEIAKQFTTVVNGVSGRAQQMNKGAKLAKGEILLFLHADTILPKNALKNIQNSKAKWGAFHQKFNEPSQFYRFISWRSNKIRLELFHTPFGDQAIFMKKDFFMGLGGYENKFMEDVLLSEKANKVLKPHIITTPVITSARRFEDSPLSTYIKMSVIMILHHCKVPGIYLKRLYK